MCSGRGNCTFVTCPCRAPPGAPQHFVKPTLQRQLNADAAVYNRAKRLRNRLVEEFVADPALCPF